MDGFQTQTVVGACKKKCVDRQSEDPTRCPRINILDSDKLAAPAWHMTPRSGPPAMQEVLLPKNKIAKELFQVLRARSRMLRAERKGVQQHTHPVHI